MPAPQPERIIERETVHVHHYPEQPVEQVKTSPTKEQKEFVEPTKNTHQGPIETPTNFDAKFNEPQKNTPENALPILTPNLTKEEPNFTPKLSPNLTDDDELSVITPFPETLDFEGRGPGRVNTFYESIDLLNVVRSKGKWPGGMTAAMQRYYKREYKEYFGNARAASKKREENQAKAERLRAENRPRRRKSDKVHDNGLAPVDIQSRRKTGS